MVMANTSSFSCQKCQKTLEDLGVKVQDLQQKVEDSSGSHELPAETITLVDSLRQQHHRLLLPLSVLRKIHKNLI